MSQSLKIPSMSVVMMMMLMMKFPAAMLSFYRKLYFIWATSMDRVSDCWV